MSGIHLAVLCAAAEGRVLMKKKERKKVQQRLLTPSGIPLFTIIFTVKLPYVQIPCPLPIVSNSITCIFHHCYCYCRIPLLSNSTLLSKLVYFTFKFQYLQIPRHLIYSQNSSTCKFIQPVLPTRLTSNVSKHLSDVLSGSGCTQPTTPHCLNWLLTDCTILTILRFVLYLSVPVADAQLAADRSMRC